MFARVGSIFLEGHAYSHGKFVYCSVSWHTALCTYSQWCLPTSVAEILAEGLCLSPTSASNRGKTGGGLVLFGITRCKGHVEVPTTLDVKAGRTILQVNEVLLSGLLLLEGKDGQECHEHSKNYAPCHLSIEGTIHPKLAVVPEGLPCFICEEKKEAATIFLCDHCQHGWHMACLRPPSTSLSAGQWNCPCCRGFLVPSASTSRTQWACVAFTMLCMPKWKMMNYNLKIRSNVRW